MSPPVCKAEEKMQADEPSKPAENVDASFDVPVERKDNAVHVSLLTIPCGGLSEDEKAVSARATEAFMQQKVTNSGGKKKKAFSRSRAKSRISWMVMLRASSCKPTQADDDLQAWARRRRLLRTADMCPF